MDSRGTFTESRSALPHYSEAVASHYRRACERRTRRSGLASLDGARPCRHRPGSTFREPLPASGSSVAQIISGAGALIYR
jgi:hypothetical protein